MCIVLSLPTQGPHMIKKLCRNFLWKGNSEAHKLHLVNWSKVAYPQAIGGLGIISLKIRNKSLIAKWIWPFRVEQNALWRKVIAAKYGISL